MRNFYIAKDGRPLTREEFAPLFEDMKYRRIAEDPLPNGGRVSTVWMGINHGADELGRPLIFETMAFDAAGDELDCRRSATEEQARADHTEVLAAASLAAQLAKAVTQ